MAEPASAAGGRLPSLIPGATLLEELGETGMHRDVRIGVDAVDLQLHKVLRQRCEAGIGRCQPILVLLERDQHLVDDLFRQIGTP